MGQYSGTFFYVLMGRWATLCRLMMDGTIVDIHGVEQAPITLDTLVVSKNHMSTLVATAGKRTRFDRLNTDGLELRLEDQGRWVKTLDKAIDGTNSVENALLVKAAYTARYFSAAQKAA